MAYTAVPAEFVSRRTVSNPMCLRPGGGIGTCNYNRRAFNVVISGAVIARNEATAKAMKDKCSLPDTCAPPGDPMIGKTLEGKVVKACDVTERRRRLESAYACAKSTLKAL
jgi:hypothetical protein